MITKTSPVRPIYPLDLFPSSHLTATSLARLGGQISRLSQLPSLRLMINNHVGSIYNTDRLLQVMHYTTRVLKHIDKTRLSDVEVEFNNLDGIGIVGRHIFEGGPVLESCRALEEVLLAFNTPGRILFGRLEGGDHRVARAQFWSPTIKRAFSRLSEQGLLTLMWSDSEPLNFVRCLRSHHGLTPFSVKRTLHHTHSATKRKCYH